MTASKGSLRKHSGGTVESARRNRQTLSNQPERLARLRRMVGDGASITEISQTLHMSTRTINKYCPGAGWPVGAPPGQKVLARMKAQVGL